ncbi:MAG TPA: dTDP-4-dehydrorhamnose 3,5-epimerase [Polyangiaceae bacterium]|nr:dTDP-4-dehydrorhamnose 3,5-epimerase [Polyangiaceae bacterium]
MQASDLRLSGLKLIRPQVFRDERGFFVETYHAQRYRDANIGVEFVQDNYSRSARGTLRGLHYQSSPGQAKLVRVTAGRIYDVVVDIRPHSPTFGQWEGLHLDSEEHLQLFIPVGFAHGFCAVSEVADVQYKVSNFYSGATECGLRYDDPDIGVVWPISDPVLSERDRNAESFREFRARALK